MNKWLFHFRSRKSITLIVDYEPPELRDPRLHDEMIDSQQFELQRTRLRLRPRPRPRCMETRYSVFRLIPDALLLPGS
jgi:hypothetical protein